jgi:hypothetical protein
MLYLIKGIGQKNGGDMPEQSSTQTAVQQALIEQVTQYIAQYTPQPRIISYKPNASGDVMGKFESQSRVFTFRLSNKGLVYKPLVQRKDNESDDDYALRFDTGSELWLEHFDAAKAYKPKPSITVKKERGTKDKPKCSAISYQCGVCISLGKNCIKNANTAALKERLQKINSLSRMAAKGEAVPQVKTGVIGARVDPASLKKKASDFAKKQAGGVKSTNPKGAVGEAKSLTEVTKSAPKPATREATVEVKKIPYPKDAGGINSVGEKKARKEAQETAKKLSKDGNIYVVAYSRGQNNESPNEMSSYSVHRGYFRGAEWGSFVDGKELSGIDSITEAAAKTYAKDFLQPKQTTRDRQSAARAAAEPNKTTTLATPLPLTAQSQKRLERGESISDNDTYRVKKEGNKFRVTDPNKFEDKGKLVDKAGLAAHMKELEAKPSAVKKSSSMNPVIPINNNPDTMLRALRDGRLIGDAKQGYEIQQRGKDEYLVTTMPNKNGDYSGVMSRKELVDFVKGGGDASKFNKEQPKSPTSPSTERKEAKATSPHAIYRLEKFQELVNDPEYGKERAIKGLKGWKNENSYRLTDADNEAIQRQIDLSTTKVKANDLTQQKPSSKTQASPKAKTVVNEKTNEEKATPKYVVGRIAVSPQRNPLKRFGEDFKDEGSPTLGSKVREVSFPNTPENLDKFAKAGGTIPKKQNENILSLRELTDKKLPPIPLTSGKNLTPSQKKQSRTADQVAIDRTKSDVSNATKRINTLDDSIKKLKAGKGVMSEADLKKVASLERQKGEWVEQKSKHQDRLNKLSKQEADDKDSLDRLQRLTDLGKGETASDKKAVEDFAKKTGRDWTADKIKTHAAKSPADVVSEYSPKLGKEFAEFAERDGNRHWKDTRTGASFKLGDAVKNDLSRHDLARESLGLPFLEKPEPRKTPKPTVQGTGETEAERRQFLLNTNTEQTNKKAEPKREIELADIKSPQDHVKYATQELAIAKASKDPERINKWIDELQRAKKRTMSQAQVSANTYQPDLFFVNKGNPNQRSIFDRADAEYDDSVERNILSNIGLMLSRAMSGNQTSPNTVQLRKVKYADGSVSGTFTQYGAQYDFEISTKGVVINPLRVRQDRIAGVPYTKTKTVGANRKCGRGYKCKGTCISKNNKCRVDWATKQGLEQFKSMKAELDALVSPRFIEINGRQVAQQRSPEGDAKALALAKRLSEARGARKQFADESKTKAAKYYKTIGDRVDAKVAEKLKEAGLNVKQVKSTLAELDPKDIAVDPKRFQYKITGEHTASGTVGSLQGVGKWDENLAGILQVWKDPADGKTYVVNGHNRLSKANELGAEKVAVRYLDVPSHQEARTIGAMTNIAEGHGTALDAAKFFRDTNWTKEDVVKKGIPLKEKIATDGLAIASLEANLFRQVIDGELPIERAAIIGGNGLSHEKQKSLMELLEKRKSVNNSVLSELIDTVKNSGQKQEEQFDLFGNSTATVDLAIHRASLQSHIKQKLGSEKKLFGTVSKSKSAKDLERGGNQIDVDQSSKIADQAATALKMFDTIKHMSGGVSDTLNNASERLANAKTKSEREKINRETYESVLKEIQRENDKFFKAGKRSDSQQRADSNDFGCDCILTYVTDNSGNLMGVCQINGVKYRFLKPVFGATVLTPLSETGLGYLFGMAPDLSLREDDPLKGIFTLFFDPLNKALASR